MAQVSLFPAKARAAAMDVILHLGAHRTATTALQTALRGQGQRLTAQGLAVWTPHDTRHGLLAGVLPEAGPMAPAQQLRRAQGRIALAMTQMADRGLSRLLITDENIPGTPRGNIKARALYPAAGLRLARHALAFGPALRQAHLTVRALDSYWTSLLGYAVARGAPVPGPAARAAIAANPRGWRAVICDIACALPGVDLQVTLHEQTPVAHRLGVMTGGALHLTGGLPYLNATPDLPALRAAQTDAGGNPALLGAGDGRWQPFTGDDAARLRDTWADDLHWLQAGADGLAQMITDTKGATDPITLTRGYPDDQPEGCVA